MSNMLVEEMVPACKLDNLVKRFLSFCRIFCLLTVIESIGIECSGEHVVNKGPTNRECSSSSSENETDSDGSGRKNKKR